MLALANSQMHLPAFQQHKMTSIHFKQWEMLVTATWILAKYRQNWNLASVGEIVWKGDGDKPVSFPAWRDSGSWAHLWALLCGKMPADSANPSQWL